MTHVATRVPFFDRTRGDAALEPELTAAFQRVLRSGQFILGSEVATFEQECAAFLGARHAIGVSSGSDALVIALGALGVGPGDEVVVPAFTFFATASAVARLGATPVFADVEAESLTLDPASVAARISRKTRAIVPVHLFGRCARVEAIAEVAGGIPIVEDAAQAFGASRDGRSAGTLGALGCFSFFPSKNLGGYGDGGLVTTDDDGLAARARKLRVHGSARKNLHEEVGQNGRLDALQAALLRVRLSRVAALLARRAEIARLYTAAFTRAGVGGPAPAPLALPSSSPGDTVNQFVVRARAGGAARDLLRRFLEERGVGTEVYYPLPVHRQPCFSAGGPPPHLPEAERAAGEALALPIFPELLHEEVEHVTTTLTSFYEPGRRGIERSTAG